MAWLAVDDWDNREFIYNKKPIRDEVRGEWHFSGCFDNHWIELPKGTIKKLTGKSMWWYDEPVELKMEE